MKTVLVITTINHPTEAIIAFAKLTDISIVVVGDLKTPVNWEYQGVDFLGVERQKILFPEFSIALPFNHYSRKNIGYLYASKYLNADIIIDTDDDNFPLENFFIPIEKNEDLNYLERKQKFLNIYKYFTDQFIWPRGLPLSNVHEPFPFDEIIKKDVQVGVWQSLANGDTDVDAIYRLLFDKEVNFSKDKKIALGINTYSAFNSQSTFFFKKFIKLMYLPSTVSFRFTDILRGYIAQKLLWNDNSTLGFMSPIFYQKRNEHDYMKDLESELSMMACSHKIIDILNIELSGTDLDQNLLNIYDVLCVKKIVCKSELDLLRLYLSNF